MSSQQILTTVMTKCSVDKSTDHDKPHFNLIFFVRAQAKKGIVRHIDGSSVVWTLIDNSKLAHQIARLAAVVVKFGLNPSPPSQKFQFGIILWGRYRYFLGLLNVWKIVNIYGLHFNFTQSRF